MYSTVPVDWDNHGRNGERYLSSRRLKMAPATVPLKMLISGCVRLCELT